MKIFQDGNSLDQSSLSNTKYSKLSDSKLLKGGAKYKPKLRSAKPLKNNKSIRSLQNDKEGKKEDIYIQEQGQKLLSHQDEHKDNNSIMEDFYNDDFDDEFKNDILIDSDELITMEQKTKQQIDNKQNIDKIDIIH